MGHSNSSKFYFTRRLPHGFVRFIKVNFVLQFLASSIACNGLDTRQAT